MPDTQRHPPTHRVTGRQAILYALHERHIHRADLGEAAGLSPRATASALAPLLDTGQVREDGELLSLAPDAADEDASAAEGVWIRVTIRDPALAPRITRIETEGNPTPADIDSAIRAAWREVASREPKPADAERQVRLAAFVAEHGNGEQARQRWNRQNPGDGYRSRQAFHKATERALDSPERRIARLVHSRVREAREVGEAKATIPMSEWFDAAGKARIPPRST